MSSESEAGKSMDDVLASIRRIIRGTREAVGEGTDNAEPAPSGATAAEADGDGVLTLTDSRPAGAGDAGIREKNTAPQEDEALVLGPVPGAAGGPSGETATTGAEAQIVPLGPDEDVTDLPRGARPGLSLVSSADWDRVTDAAGPSLHGGLEADLEDVPAGSIGDAVDVGGPGGDAMEPEEIARPHWVRDPLVGDGEDPIGATEAAETMPETAAKAETEVGKPRDGSGPDVTGDSWMLAAPPDASGAGRGDLPIGASEAVAALDPVALEDTIRRVIREELEGEMGLRLSRNIQRMIRDEIARAMPER